MSKDKSYPIFDQVPMREALERIAITGAMRSDEEWEKSRDDFIDSIVRGLDAARAEVRYRVAQNMFRTDENE